MKIIRSKFWLIVMTFFVCLPLFDFAKAAFNPMINYQGKLTDSADSAVSDGNYNMKIRLCSDIDCSGVLWTESRTDLDKVQVTNGLFSVLLGDVATTSLSSVDFNQDVYLELQIGGTGVPSWETLLPRKRLAAVPSAFEAGNLSGKSESEFATLAEDEAVSGSWTFSDLLSITSNTALPALSVLQSGAGSGIQVGNGTATTSINGNVTSSFPYGATFATTGGNVGVGTAGPSKKLEINSATGANLRLTYNDADGSAANYTDFSLASDGGLTIGTTNSATTTVTNKLNVTSDINLTGALRISGVNYSQYFIDSDGTPGSVWMASGGGVGHWATTSSLGLSGGSLPSGTTGQTLAYGSSGWEATSTLYVIGESLFNVTSTFSSGIISEGGLFVSGVTSSNAGSVELLSNTGFESSLSSISPWSVMATSGSASYNIVTSTPAPYAGSNHLTLFSGAMSSYVVLQQSGLSNPGSTVMTASFYGVGEVGGEKARVAVMGDSCASGKWVYNFTMFSWDCVNFTGASYSAYAKDFTMTASYTQYSVSFTSLSTASSTSGLTFVIMAGSSDPGTYNAQNMAVDNFSLSYYDASVNTAFILNASSFSSTSTGDTLLSIRSNGTEKLNLTSSGTLSISDNLDVAGTYLMNGMDVGQYFISSAGTSGYLWQSDGSGAGTWIGTSSLGILPSGSSGQILSYGASSWVATSSPQLSYLSVQNKVGIGTNTPSTTQLEIMSSAVSQLKLSYNSSNFSIFEVDSSGFLNITPSSTGSSFSEGFNSSWPPNGWTTGGDLNWQQSGGVTQEGAGSAQSGSITHGQSTWIDLDVETAAGNLTFWWKVSSESNYDYLQFCYDVDITCSRTSGSIAGISGDQDWVQVTQAVSAGTHSFRWLYAKDPSASSGSDAGYVDNISVPTVAGQVSLVVNANGAFTGKLLVGTTTEFVSSSGYQLQVDSGSSDGDGIAVNGHIIASSYITGTTTVDLAESYPVLADCKLDNSCPEAADVVCATNVSSTYYVEKCASKASQKVLGVITTNPGFVLGGKSDELLLDQQNFISRAVALAGRVPVKISMTTGTVEVGDEITASDIPGFASKAIEPGRVIGTALTPFDPAISGATGTLEIFVNPHWSIGSIEEKDVPTELPDFSSTSTPNILDKFTLTIENSLQKLGLIIKNGVAKLKEIFVDKIFVKQLCVGNTCIGEQQLKELLEKNQVSQLRLIETAVSTTVGSGDIPSSGVILNDSTSTFSNFSSSTEVVNSLTNSILSPSPSVDIITPEVVSNSENFLPPISATLETVPAQEAIQSPTPDPTPVDASPSSEPALSKQAN